jgi:amidase
VDETTWLDATAQADLVRRGEVSPRELAEAAIARIEAVNPKLDAVIRTRFDAARLEAEGDLPDGPFRGVPILLRTWAVRSRASRRRSGWGRCATWRSR